MEVEIVTFVVKGSTQLYDVKVSYELNSAILLFRPDGVPFPRQRLHSLLYPSVNSLNPHMDFWGNFWFKKSFISVVT